MKFIVGLLVICILLVAQGSPPALLMAGFVAIVGCIAVGFHANAVASKAYRRQRLEHDAQMDAMEWDWYWQQQNERLRPLSDIEASASERGYS